MPQLGEFVVRNGDRVSRRRAKLVVRQVASKERLINRSRHNRRRFDGSWRRGRATERLKVFELANKPSQVQQQHQRQCASGAIKVRLFLRDVRHGESIKEISKLGVFEVARREAIQKEEEKN